MTFAFAALALGALGSFVMAGLALRAFARNGFGAFGMGVVVAFGVDADDEQGGRDDQEDRGDASEPCAHDGRLISSTGTGSEGPHAARARARRRAM